jgi:asparagine synthase (glutamine-hydrolysing)
MCGITGFCRSCSLDYNDLVAMTRAVKHRGPDDEGFYYDRASATGLGHRRLAILDLSHHGKQPMTYMGSGLRIVFNGEIYNFLELREELEQKNYRFQSETDTEVILASYLEWGVDAFAKFNGMWAFSLYDEKNGDMMLCRDRYGIKPLYYYYDHGQLVFGSEYKVFWAIRDKLRIEWDIRGIRTALVSPEVLESSGHTLLGNVRNLLPGHYLILHNGRIRVHRWWQTVDNLVVVPKSLDDQAAKLKDLLIDSCRLRMRSDVPIGSTLSGGLDSGSVSAIIGHISITGTGGQRATDNRHRCFVHSFPGTFRDETALAGKVVDMTGATGIYVKADLDDLIANLDSIIYDFETIYPGMPDSWWRIYRAMRDKGIIVSLDGHGADELFGGYRWYIPLAVRTSTQLSSAYWNLLALWYSTHMSESILSFSNRLRQGKSISFLSDSKSLPESYEGATTELPPEWDVLNKALYRDFHHTVLPRILKNFDLMSMAHGVEVRMPFMDYRIVNYAFSLPSTSKIGRGHTKLVLRLAMDGLLPEEVLSRRYKTAFNSPLHEWIPAMDPWIKSTLDMQTAACSLISVEKLRKYYHGRIVSGRFSSGEARDFLKYVHAIRLTGLMGRTTANRPVQVTPSN